jgi:hypothetical protein
MFLQAALHLPSNIFSEIFHIFVPGTPERRLSLESQAGIALESAGFLPVMDHEWL